MLLKPTRFLALVSFSTLHLCKSLARFLLSQTIPFLAMDILFADHDYFSDEFVSTYHLTVASSKTMTPISTTRGSTCFPTGYGLKQKVKLIV